MFLRFLFCIVLLISIGSQINAEDSPRKSLLGDLLRSKGKIHKVVNDELAATVDNIIGTGHKLKDSVIDTVKFKLTIFGEPEPSSDKDKPISGLRKWISDRFKPKDDPSTSSDKKPFGFLIFPPGIKDAEKDPTSTSDKTSAATTETAARPKPDMSVTTPSSAGKPDPRSIAPPTTTP